MKPRLLVVVPYPLFPPSTGGKIRVYRLALELTNNGFEVTILTPFKPGQVQFRHPDLKLKQVPYPFLGPLLFTDRPFPYGYLVSMHPGFGFGLRRFIRSFDAVMFEHVFFADLVSYVKPGTPIFLNSHNVEFDYVKAECRNRLVGRIAGERTRRLEGDLINAANRIFTCSHEDNERLEEVYEVDSKKLVVIPNGIEKIYEPGEATSNTLEAQFPGLSRYPRRAIFSGSNVDHNRRAVRYILKHLAPALKDKVAFVIHGECGQRFPHRQVENVYFDLSFEKFDRYQHQGFIGLNPVWTGSGTNLKLINYLTHGLQVLSTPFGMRGYSAFWPHVTVGEMEDFAQILERNPHAPPPPKALLEQYLWSRVGAAMSDVIHASLSTMAELV